MKKNNIYSKQAEQHVNELTKYEQLIDSFVAYWVPVLGLDSWSRITTHVRPDSHAGISGTIGEATVNWRYMEANIDFYLGALVGTNYESERIEYIVLHELCHCLVNEMRDENSTEDNQHKYLIPHEERVVSNLAMSFIRLKYGKKKR